MNEPNHPADDSPLFCARCAKELIPGAGNFYVVRIEAFADPTLPSLPGEEAAKDYRREIERLLAAMQNLSEQELLDQIYRRLTLYLCGRCYRRWIENPAGSPCRR